MALRRVLLYLCVTCALHGGTISGIVLEQSSGLPLSRTVVRLDVVPGGRSLPPLITRTSQSGQFVFPSVPAGSWTLTALRNHYFSTAYQQRLPAGRGAPVVVTGDSTLFAELRMHHKGALTGRVLDENGVGAAGVPVLAYRARLPLRSVSSTLSDDRGMFRISGLEPGKYWVRSGGHTLEDGSGWGATFAPQDNEPRHAKQFVLTVAGDTPDADVRPQPGPLFLLSGVVACDSGDTVTIALSSETGQRNAQTNCGGSYQIAGLPPGNYDIFAWLPNGGGSAFLDFSIGGNTKANLTLAKALDTEIDTNAPAGSVRLLGRRQNLAESGTLFEIPFPRTRLDPGYWEMRAIVPAGSYVQSIRNLGSGKQGRYSSVNPPDWFEVFVEPNRRSTIRVTVSDQAASITGIVQSNREPVPAAPVFLWPMTEAQRRSTGGALETIADIGGRYSFTSLPPGDYQIVASFDLNEADEDRIEQGGFIRVHCDAQKSATVDLSLWAAPQ